MKQIIVAKSAPEAIGPYSHGTAFGGLIFTSGQLPVDGSTGSVVEGGITAQSEMSLKNLISVIEAADGDVNTVLKTTCYLANITDFSAFNEVYKTVFHTDCPARSCFAVKDLPLGVLVEVEAIAHKKNNGITKKVKKMNSTWKQYITILKNVVKPALGCTEPICAAYATSVATQMLGEKPETIDVFVSDNLYKNSMGVFVPRTGRVGLAIAAATGATGGNPDAGLEVLAKLTESQVSEAQQLIDAGRVQVKREATEEFIYCRVILKSSQHHAEVTISGGHTLIVEKRLDGNIIFALDSSLPKASTASICDGVDITISSIYDFATKAEFDDIKFILEAKELNIALAQEGLNNPYGLEVGRTYQKNIDTGLLSKSLDSDILIYTSAASDARMGGATLPAMSNYGSGNQGIAATIPVVKMADFYNADEETLARAFIMSHLGAIYIKSHYPPLSAFCGNAVTSAAAAMAMVYLAGGTFEQSCSAIQNTISDTSGMICDGAKSTCAMKVGSSAQSAMKSSLLALNDHCVTKQGVIADDVEKTIKNIGRMITTGMPNIDHEIIEIMAS